MRSFIALLAIALCVVYVNAECDSDSWYKNIGCKIKEGASDLSEAAKPLADKIGTATKDFGHSVASTYSDLKQKLTDDNKSQGDAASTLVIENAPTEKIPLAPLAGEAPRTGAA